MQTQEISIIHLTIGLLLLVIPCVILWRYRTGLTKALLISGTRMVAQLFMVGIYLKYLFAWNNPWVNIGWLVTMTAICTIDLLNRVNLSRKALFVPIYLAIFVSLAAIAVYFLKVVLGNESLFDSRYFIPICGILFGNILSSNVVGLNAFYGGIQREQQMYNYLLCNGATVEEATRPFIREALIKSFNPTIASMAVMGLISLPGTLIGQIIGGSSPDVAIRYQIMIMVIITASSIISLLLSLLWSVKSSFDGYGRFKSKALLI